MALEVERLELVADEMRDAHAERERVRLLRRVEVEEHEVRPLGLVDARVPRVHVDAVHLHHPEERLAAVHEREVDEPGRALPPRGHVRNWRVGIHDGIPFGACFWKKLPPARPSRHRFMVNGRSRRCGTIASATAS